VRICIDIGSDVDDAVALAYVIAHPAFELVGVSTVFGHEGRRLLDAPDPALRTESESGGPGRTAALGEAIDAARPDGWTPS